MLRADALAQLVGVAQPGRLRLQCPMPALCGSVAVLEAPTLVAGLDGLSMVRQAVEERYPHLGVTEHGGRFTKGEVGGDDHRGAIIEAADQMEQQLPAGLGAGQKAQLIENREVELGEVVSDAALPALAVLGPQPVCEVDSVEEAAARDAAYSGAGNGNGEIGLAGPRAVDVDPIALAGDEGAGGQVLQQALVDRVPVKSNSARS